MFNRIVLNRKSVRKFKNEPISDKCIDYIKTAIYFSPSSRGIRPYKVIFVTNKTMLNELSKAKKGAELLNGVAIAIVIVADTSKSDVWIEDCSIAAVSALYACEELGLGACWVQIRNRFMGEISANTYVSELLNIPAPFSVECIIGIGHKDESHTPHDPTQIDNTVFYDSAFGEY